MLQFHSVLQDIPGQPKGIFVSEHGYQSGALKVATATGIEACVIKEVSREAPPERVKITHLSIAWITQKPDQVAFECMILEPTIKKFKCR
jgi:hypothetical protein